MAMSDAGMPALQRVWQGNTARAMDSWSDATQAEFPSVPAHISARARAYVRDAAAIAPRLGDGSYGWIVEQVERALIERLVVQTNGNKSRMAKLMGISRTTLYTRMVKLGIIVQ